MLRIATSGWLTIGVWKRPANFPALVTVKVEPRSSSGFRVPARAPSASRRISASISSTVLLSAPRTTGTTRPCVRLNGDADVVAVEVDDRIAVEPRVQLAETRPATSATAFTTVARSRSSSTRSKSHSSTQVTAGSPEWARRHVLGDDAANAAKRLASSLPRTPPPAAARTSSSVIRPPGPVAETVARSTPSSVRDLPHQRRRLRAVRRGGGRASNAL